MVFRCLSFGIDGIDGFKVEVEASSTMDFPTRRLRRARTEFEAL